VKNNVRPKELSKTKTHRTHQKQRPDRAIRPSGDSSQGQAREPHCASAFVMDLEFRRLLRICCGSVITVRPQVKAEPQEICLHAARMQESLPSVKSTLRTLETPPRRVNLAIRPSPSISFLSKVGRRLELQIIIHISDIALSRHDLSTFIFLNSFLRLLLIVPSSILSLSAFCSS
jgi:hypothetical protein